MGSLQNLVMVMLVASLFIISIGNFTGEIYTTYGNVQNVSYIQRSEELAGLTTGIKDDINSQGIDDEGTEDSMFKGSFSAFKRIIGSLNIFQWLIRDTGSLLQLDDDQQAIFYTIVLVLVIMAIIAVVFRTKSP